jgi:hypothetical protein
MRQAWCWDQHSRLLPLSRTALTSLADKGKVTGRGSSACERRERAGFLLEYQGKPQKLNLWLLIQANRDTITAIMDKSLSQEEEEMFAQLLELLREQFRRAGHGSKKRVLEELGTNNAAFDIAFKRGSVTILLLTRVLKALGISPGDFFARIYPPGRPLPPGIPPAGVLRALERMKEEKDV